MRSKHVNLLIALVAFMLFAFSCFCISRMTQTNNQLINCRNHISEFKETILRLKNKSEANLKDLMKALSYMKYEITLRGDSSENLVAKKVDTLSENEAIPDRFEDIKFFLPHLRKVERIYPHVIIGKQRTGVSFALGIPTTNRGNHTYLKQTLTSLLSRMTPAEEEDSVVIVAIAESNEEYLNSVVDMIKKKFKRQLKFGSLEIISIPSSFYPDILLANQTIGNSEWQMKQVLDFCILMLYAQPKAIYYLQLEDDIIAKKMYFTEMAYFVNNIAPENWFFVEFSELGFIGKLFRSEDIPDFVRFFLMFYKDKPIDLLLEDIFLVKMCGKGENLRNCVQRNHETRVQYKPSLFQHVGIHSSLFGKEQHLKDNFY
uniref:MGAT4 conserved region domain-containing protein n=1 Tax=Castor canadensis TaxID=51338 RepID=A0A8C0W1X7_CASCN